MARGRRRRAGPGWIRVAGASLVAAGGSAIGMSVSAFATTGATAPHVMVVTMENKNYSEVVGAANQPVTNALADDYGLATDSYSVAHPSLPNYIDLVSGQDPSNAADDGPPSAHTYSYPTIADQLQAAGYSTQAFAEDLPADPTNDDGEYAVRHNPWEYFPATPINVADAATMVGDLDSTDPPDFVWYTPDMLDDEHTGEPVDSLATEEAAGESFLSSFIPEVQATTWYQQGGQIVIEWDESDTDDTNGGGHIPTIVVSAALKADPRQSSTEVDTTGVLNSIEDVYGLPHLGEGVGTIDALLTLGTPTTTTTTPSSSTTTAPAAPTTTVAAASATTTTVPTVFATTAPTTTTPTATVSGGAGTTTTLPPAVGAAASGGAAPASSQASASASSAATDPPSADGGGTDPSVVTAASTDLAFTGAGPGVRTLTLAGAALVLVGLAALVLAGPPRRRLLAAAGREQTRRLFALQGDVAPTADPWARPRR
ncbi:MAG TPA: alkaline phosphatase family protein [Acidimicrobiales bacterium]|nr:alkaline phosphatase family protein [Acidimicrobiales bacterium]